MIEHAGISEQGHVRFRNEDFLAHEAPLDPEVQRRLGSLFVVADGVGGSGAGDVASRAATETLVSAYYGSNKRPDRALLHAFARANLHVYDLGLKAGAFRMQTTMVALALVGDKAYVAHVGDSRAYRVRSATNIQALTRDHSEVAELVRMQILTPENARHHPRRHIITRSVGSLPVLQVPSRVETLEPGDAFVLCTDGLWEPLDDFDIAGIVTAHAPAEACRRLIALGLERQATDNLSALIVKVLEVEKESAAGVPNSRTWWQTLLHGLKRPTA